MKLLAVDGNSIINRAFYGIKLLSTKTGIYTNGIYGFMNILNKLLETENPDGAVIAFDLKSPTFRHKKYAGYKAGRKPMPEELRMQVPILKELLTDLGYTCLEKEGYEADDILGTLSFSAEQNENVCVISTGDKDSLQLVSKETSVLLATTKFARPEILKMTPETVLEKYGLTPKQLIDLKALMGDQSDKIPGVAGIGEKTGIELIKNFGSLNGVYENINSPLIKEGVRTKLIKDKENAYLSYFLGTIYKEVPISLNFNDYKFKPVNKKETAKLLRKLEFFKLLEKYNLQNEPTEDETSAKSSSLEESELLFKKCRYTKGAVFVNLTENGSAIAFKNGFDTLNKEQTEEFLKANIKNIVTSNSKEIYKILLKNNTVNGTKESESKNEEKKENEKNVLLPLALFDCSLAGYLLSPDKSNYKTEGMFNEYIGVFNTKIENSKTENGKEKEESAKEENTNEELLITAAETEAVKGYLLFYKLKELLKETNQYKLFCDVEMPLSLVLADMETVGFKIDKTGLKNMDEELEIRLSQLLTEIENLAGEKFNVNSPKQLGVILFEKLNLPAKKKTKSGYSTSAEVLESLKDQHEIIPKILEYRVIAKLKSTYCDGLLKNADKNGVIHTTFNQTETKTGRISSLEPNLQNIPVRREEGKKLRKFFVAREGKTLIDADYSQIELRVLASIANDKNMIEAFLSNEDIHTITASKVFNLPEKFITPALRSRAKAVNFGIVYGIGAFSLAKDIGISRNEAAELIKGYFNTYPNIEKYMEEVVEKAKEQGFVTSLYNRRRYLPELKNSNHMIRAFGERVARNMPIQGTAADIIKIAMVNVYKRLKEEKINADLILQIHDELILESDVKDKEKAKRILEEEMQNAAKLKVPLISSANDGKTWLKAKA